MTATPTEIQHFVEIYQAKHVSRAAIRLGVTQPTLTQSLMRLEEKLRTRLFHRTKQGVVPTVSGTHLYKNARSLLDSWNGVTGEIQAINNEVQGRFRVGCHQSVAAYTVPILLKNLNEFSPKIEIDLIHDFSRRITEGIVSYAIDIGYVVNPVRHPDLVLKKIGNDEVMFWKKKGLAHPPKRIITDANLTQVEGILGQSHKSLFKDWSLVSTVSLELVRTLTLRGQGIGILPERVAKADGADLIEFDSNLPTHRDEIYLAYRKDVLSSKAGKELVRHASFLL